MPGDPRIERTRQHVLACAREMLLCRGAQVLRDVAQLRQETLSRVTGPLSDAEFALTIGPLLFQTVIARRPVTDEFLDELAAASAARSDR
jgi:hypothetical protein